MVPKDHPLVARVVELLPIAGLEAWLREEVLAQGELVQFKRRATIFKEGDDDPYSVFLVDGEIELKSGDRTPSDLRAGVGDALRALAQLRPRRYTARCNSEVTVFRIRRAVLDHILSDEQVSKEGSSVSEDGIEVDESDEDAGDWMSRLLESELFTRLPPDHMARFFAELDPVMVEPDEVIVEQGTPGDFLYIVAEGQCTVVRKARGSAHEQTLAQLTVGDVFGEESLISETPRNATVRAITEGMVMRLPKASFEELVSRPVLRPITFSDAESLVAAGAQWIDVRFQEEYELDGLTDARNIPLGLLRLELPKLDPGRTYITYCDSGGRASTAAFLMMRERFETMYLAGGLQHVPSITDDDTDEGAAADGGFQFELENEAPEPAASEPPAPAAEAAGAAPKTDAPAPVDVPTDDTSKPEPELAVLETKVASVRAELDAAVGQLHDERERHEKALTTARDELSQLRLDRDGHAARANKAVAAARELKQRGEQAVRALSQERAQLTRAKELQAKTEAEAKRAIEMERLRLNKELETLQGRLDATRAEFEAKAAEERAQTARQEDVFEQRVLILESDLADRENTQAELENKATEDLETANAKVSVLEAEAATLRARIEVLEARFEATRKTIVEQESQLQDAARQVADQHEEDERELDDQREQLALARAELDAERRSSTQQQDDFNAALEERRRVLEATEGQLAKDRDALARERDTWAREHAEQQANYARRMEERETMLGAAESALREEESQWQRRVAEAVKDERQKLEQELGEIEHAMSAFEIERTTTLDELAARETAVAAERDTLAAAQRLFEEQETTNRAEADALSDTLALREQELAKARAEFELEQVSQAEQHEGAMKRLLERARGEMAQLKNAYEKKLGEQAALLADERRRLENQAVRLDEALAQSRPEPDALVLDVGVRQAPEVDNEQTERARVMTPAQLKELRQRMQDKMSALKQG